MSVITKTTYTCDWCKVDVSKTRAGKLYGPLCVAITAPRHSHDAVDAHFCCLDHATEWMQANVGRTVLN